MKHSRKVGAALTLVLLAAGAGRTAEDAEVRKLVEEAIKAKGGAANLEKYRADQVKLKGTVHVMGMDFDFTGSIAADRPNRLRTVSEVEVMGMNFKHIEVLDGKKGWISENGEVKEMEKRQLARSREEMYLRSLTHLVVLQKKDCKLSPVGEARVGGHAAIGIRVVYKGQPDVNLFFDKKTHLLVKSEFRSTDPMTDKEFTDTRRYENYKKVDGVQVPHKIVIEHDEKPFIEAEVTEVKLARDLPADLFGKP